MEPVGHHYIAEASGCNPETIGKVETVEQILVRAAEVAGVTVWSISFHRFSPNGVSGVVVISESHLSVHTWPEYGYVALDIFTCGSEARPEAAVEYALKEFGANSMHITEVTRGLEEGDRQFYHSIVTWEETIPAKDGQKRPRPTRRARTAKRRPVSAR
ncbi:MAG: adenosylmethionine decarboxylase [Armatimonadota bacterium]|nr:adenosylmethionine decarboxylase [Armatimonadota bacterium]MDR7518397.1 adenosylmethionine decarboxylase [Armatimonadota bacterium]MDR7549305.1 adenosylmethionine decarboxylase [Armatimonadota bacterium]